MAENDTNLFLEILRSFDAVPLIIAFCVSIAVGLVLGALVYVILTWMSRRKAGSARITRRPPRQSRMSPRGRPGFNRNSSYDRRSNNSLCSQIAREAEEGSQTTLPRTPTLTTSAGSPRTEARPAAAPPRPESFWGNNGLKGSYATQTPPPAYESIIRAYQETCT
uniref:myc target protein 1 homolog isoform X2 n=1 Tax=Gasterosteus aculeatus aculeatus TaxID=481459 RepID=UPI001A99E222|nr:myc target protein 1 homolog isoform X2 [Gasterosteus aculeatus aculeatus]